MSAALAPIETGPAERPPPAFQRVDIDAGLGEKAPPILRHSQRVAAAHQQTAFDKSVEPFKIFMLKHVREKDLALFEKIAAEKLGSQVKLEADDFRILIPAFMVSELRRGFEIGFLIALPFLVIDMIVATVVMSMGMMMMPPTVVSLPLKVLFFVLIDGWNLLIGTLVRSFT